MKRMLGLSLALLYTVTVLGFALNFHYCFNRVSGITLNQPVKMCTSKKLSRISKCCKDKHVDVKVKDGHQGSSQQFSAQRFALDLPYTTFSKFPNTIKWLSIMPLSDRGPPIDLSARPAIFLANRTFLI